MIPIRLHWLQHQNYIKNIGLLTYLSGATTALRSWPASEVSENAHGLTPSSASPFIGYSYIKI